MSPLTPYLTLDYYQAAERELSELAGFSAYQVIALIQQSMSKRAQLLDLEEGFVRILLGDLIETELARQAKVFVTQAGYVKLTGLSSRLFAFRTHLEFFVCNWFLKHPCYGEQASSLAKAYHADFAQSKL